MKLEKQKAFLIHVIYFAFIILLAYIGLKYVLPLLTPFVIGFIVAFLLRPVIDLVANKTTLKRSIVAIITLIVLYGVLVLIIGIFGSKLVAFLEGVFLEIPSIYTNTIQPAFDKVLVNIGSMFPEVNQYWDNILANINSSLNDTISSISKTALSAITGFAGQVPSFLIRFLFTIVSSFFFTIDYYKIVDFVLKQLPEERKEGILRIKTNGIGTVGKFLRAYLTLIIITFVELAIGFSILRVPNALLVAAIVAFIDILPILGTGAVLLPWVIISFLFGNTTFAIGMLILYIVITVVRQTLEPRVVGDQIGLHPVITLICMFVGTNLFGILGLFLFPIAATIVKQMNDEGAIHLFK
jgi:sporulation integral membrane protein YtvI